jgi:hypothetical protein
MPMPLSAQCNAGGWRLAMAPLVWHCCGVAWSAQQRCTGANEEAAPRCSRYQSGRSQHTSCSTRGLVSLLHALTTTYSRLCFRRALYTLLCLPRPMISWMLHTPGGGFDTR